MCVCTLHDAAQKAVVQENVSVVDKKFAHLTKTPSTK